MIAKSPFPDVEIPDVPLHEFVLRRAEDLHDKPAFIDASTGDVLTFSELANSVRAAACGLSLGGFRKGDTLALCSPNMPAYAVAYFAVSSLGGVVTTMNPLNTPHEIANQLVDSGARAIVTVPPLLEKVKEALGTENETGGKPSVEDVYVFGEAEGTKPFSALVEEGTEMLAGDGGIPEVDIDPRNDVVALPYSSGTTGLPKGVMLTHHNLVSNLAQFIGAEDPKEDWVAIGVLPFFHIYGMVAVMCAVIASGSTVVTIPRFELEEFLRVIQEYRVTRAHLVPPIALALAKHPIVDNFDLSSLHYITVGAAPVSMEIADACEQRIGCHVREGYGLTEASPVTHFTPLERGEHRPGAAGPPVPNTETKVVDLESGETLGANEEGEVCVRGPQVMKGYLNNPEATAITVDDEGWLRTGDVGRMDEDGWLYLVDRAKELIKYKGYQVAPAELENLLISHPEIADAAVVPKPDEEAGEVPRAFVVPSGDISAEEIMEFVADNVAPYKKVREVVFVDEIPKSPSGKILRRVLRDRG